MSEGLLYCKDRDTDCMEMYIGNGVCNRQSCVRDDLEYLAKEKAQERRRNELLEKERQRRKEESTAATKIRKQTKTKDTLIKEQIEATRAKMERYYTRGWTKAADRLSRELAALQRKLEEIS